MAKGHPKIRARYAIRGAGFWIWDAEFGVEAGGVSPNPPSGRRQRLVVYCNGRCTGAAGRRIRPHPAFWELCCSLPRIYEVINEIKNAAAKRTKKHTKKALPSPASGTGQVLGPGSCSCCCSSLGFDFLVLVLWEMPKNNFRASFYISRCLVFFYAGLVFNLRARTFLPSCIAYLFGFLPFQVQIITVKYEICKVLCIPLFMFLAINLGRIFTGRIRCGGLISAKNELGSKDN